MKQKGNWMHRIGGQVGLMVQPLQEIPIVELAGDRRVLIENHLGVQEYWNNRVKVSVRYGCVFVEGNQLEIVHMSSKQLVITGTIFSVKLERG